MHDVDPSFGAYWPAGHGVHDGAFGADENDPCGHGLHAAETASSGSEPERDVRAWRRERRSAKPAKPRTAFEKPRAGARPPSPVSPLTPSGVAISPLSISLRGVRKSLA